MNIERAKRVPLPTILNILGLTETQLKNIEDTDVITSVCRYLESCGENAMEADAGRWIMFMTGQAPRIAPVAGVIPPETDHRLYVDGITPIRPRKNVGLIQHLENQSIPLNIGKRYLKRIRIYSRDDKEPFYAFGFRNESGGWFYLRPDECGFIGKMDISFIRGTDIKPDGIHIFKNDRDFMSALIRLNNGRPLKCDALILNDMVNLPKATPYIYQYGYRAAFTWMDNSEIGQAAAQSLDNYFKTEDRLVHMLMNNFYAPFLDVRTWHMTKRGLTE